LEDLGHTWIQRKLQRHKSFRLIGAYAELGWEVLEKKLLGYRSRAEFVAEAVRDKLMQVKNSWKSSIFRLYKMVLAV